MNPDGPCLEVLSTFIAIGMNIVLKFVTFRGTLRQAFTIRNILILNITIHIRRKMRFLISQLISEQISIKLRDAYFIFSSISKYNLSNRILWKEHLKSFYNDSNNIIFKLYQVFWPFYVIKSHFLNKILQAAFMLIFFCQKLQT